MVVQPGTGSPVVYSHEPPQKLLKVGAVSKEKLATVILPAKALCDRIVRQTNNPASSDSLSFTTAPPKFDLGVAIDNELREWTGVVPVRPTVELDEPGLHSATDHFRSQAS